MQKQNIVAVVSKIVEHLTPLESEDRHRVIQAAFTLLGEKSVTLESKSSANNGKDDLSSTEGGFGPRVQAWMKQNQITAAEVQLVFHLDGEASEIIAAAIPGNTTKERTLNVYVLEGLGRFLATGNPSFTDKAARSACVRFGFYDDKAHSRNVEAKGNKFAGSKQQGWILTAPGLSFAASLVKQIVAP